MGKTGVNGPGEDEMQKSILPDIAQPLELSGSYDGGFKRRKLNIAVDWVPNGTHPILLGGRHYAAPYRETNHCASVQF